MLMKCSRHLLRVLTNEGKEINRIKIPYKFAEFRLTHSENIIMATPAGRTSQYKNIGNIAEDTRLISLYDMDGNFLKEFGEVKDYRNNDLTYAGNVFEFCLDKEDNIYVAFQQQNRIEKYSLEGDLIFRADRPLDYKIVHENKLSILIRIKVSGSIGIDHQNRIWVQTYKKQMEEGEKPFDYLEFEIYDNDGILLGKLPIPQNFHLMRIFQDRLYLLERVEEMCVYEYKIVEK